MVVRSSEAFRVRELLSDRFEARQRLRKLRYYFQTSSATLGPLKVSQLDRHFCKTSRSFLDAALPIESLWLECVKLNSPVLL
jgi:hypothetical protein